MGSLAAYAIQRSGAKLSVILVVLVLCLKMIPTSSIVVPIYELICNLGLYDTRIALVNSMEPRIYENDVVIVRQQNDAESGDVVIATINGDEATCKRLRKYRDGIELISNNPSYEPMFFSNEEILSKPVRIIGKVVELRGKF